jgi:hypothetical protein
MAVTLIHDTCEAGALAGLLGGRSYQSLTVGDYAAVVAQAKAIADEFITLNTAGPGTIADGTPASVAYVVLGVAQGVLAGRGPTGLVATNAAIVQTAGVIFAAVKEAIAVGGLT